MLQPTSQPSHADVMESTPSQAMLSNRVKAGDVGNATSAILESSYGKNIRILVRHTCASWKSGQRFALCSVIATQRGTRCSFPRRTVPKNCEGIPQKPPSGLMSVSPGKTVPVRSPPVGRNCPSLSLHCVSRIFPNASR